MTFSLAPQIPDHLQDVADMTGFEIMRLEGTCFPGGESETDRKASVSNIFAPRRRNGESG
ncbi:hypothetical protein [Ruegeria atlantica]|uniref:hypothetical protein n=1 Tax=Ruegeria atlantica TaxID=81569 RepID=UPI00147D8571|nr:hypothetical protein [Ruegeria atlantica]